jgi:hypothetical protein
MAYFNWFSFQVPPHLTKMLLFRNEPTNGFGARDGLFINVKLWGMQQRHRWETPTFVEKMWTITNVHLASWPWMPALLDQMWAFAPTHEFLQLMEIGLIKISIQCILEMADPLLINRHGQMDGIMHQVASMP